MLSPSFKLKEAIFFLLCSYILSILTLFHPTFGQTSDGKEPVTKEEAEEIRDVDYLKGLFYDLKSKDIPSGSEIVYLDDGDPQTDTDKTLPSADGRFRFNRLTSPSDYTIDYREGILRLSKPLEIKATLALYHPGIAGATVAIGGGEAKFRLIVREDELRNRYKLRHGNILTDRGFSYAVVDTQSGQVVDRQTHPAFYQFRLEKREGLFVFAEAEPFRLPGHNPYGDPPQERYHIRVGYRYSINPLPEEYETFTIRPEVRDLPLDATLRFKGEQNISLSSGYAAFVQPRPQSRPSVQIAEPFDLRQSLQVEIEGKALADQLSIDVQYSSKEDQDILLTQPDRITIGYDGKEQTTDYGGFKLDILAGNKVPTDLSEATELDVNSREVLGIRGGFKATDLKIGDLTLIHRAEVKGIASRSGGIAATDRWVGGRGVEEEKIPDLTYVKSTYYDVGAKNIPPGSERVFVDDRNASTDTPNTITSDDGLYRFDRQFTPRDYTLDYTNGVIRFERTIGVNSVIAISYSGMVATGNQTRIGGESFNIIKASGEAGPELKNRYHLKRINIIPIERDDDFVFEIVDSGTGQVVIRSQSTAKLYDFQIDYDGGVLAFKDPLPFDSDVGGMPFGDRPHAYSSAPQERYRIRMRYKYDQEFRLSHINVTEGSESVLIGQGFAIRQLKRDEDYTIFYEIGRINFSDHVRDTFTDTTRITVNYEYAPFVGAKESTLVGARLEIEPIAGLEVGGTYYRNFADSSRIAPTLGSEPPALGVWDVNAKFDLAKMLSGPKQDGITTAVPTEPQEEDIPQNLVGKVSQQEKKESPKQTDVPWRLTLDAEVAGSIREPNIFDVPAANEFSVALIDDMEGAKSRADVGLAGRGWLKSSAPVGIEGEAVGQVTARNVEERPFRGKAEDRIKSLELSYGPGDRGGRWAGIRRLVSPDGADYTDYTQLEIVIRSDRWDRDNDLHINLGQISEDTPINGFFNGRLDTEDVNGDGALNADEDAGIDNIPNGQIGDDAEDDFDKDANLTGTEGNSLLDTEDMDGDGTLQATQGYLEYILPLNLNKLKNLSSLSNGQIVLEEDPESGWKRITIPLRLDELITKGELRAGSVVFGRTLDQEGARLPVDYRRLRVKHVRIWTEAETPGTVGIESLGLLRNEWKVVDQGKLASSDVFETGSISRTDDPAYNYDSPFYFNPDDPKKEKERSLVISYDLGQGTAASAVKTFGEPLGLITYQDIRFSINLRTSESESLGENLFFRLGGDENNYIQYNTRLDRPGVWQNKVLALKDIQERLKGYYQKLDRLRKGGMTITPSDKIEVWGDLAKDGFDYLISGEPSLESVKVLSIGIVGGRVGVGENVRRYVWVNDIRATGGSKVRVEEFGGAWRAEFDLGYKDVFSLKAKVRRRESRFRSIGDSLGPLAAGPDKMNYQGDLSYDQLKFLPFLASTSGERAKKDTESIVNPSAAAALDDDKIIYNQHAQIGFNLSGLPQGKSIAEAAGDIQLTLSGDYLTDEFYTPGGALEPSWYKSWQIEREDSGGIKRKTDFTFTGIPRLIYRFPQEILSVPMGRENEWEIKYTHNKKWTRFSAELKDDPKTVADIAKLSVKALKPDNTLLASILGIREPVEIKQELLTGWKFQPIRGISLNPVNTYTYGLRWNEARQDETKVNLSIRVGNIDYIEKNIPWLAPRFLYTGSNLLDYQQRSLSVKGSPEVALEVRGVSPKDAPFLSELAPWSVELPIVRLNGTASYKNVVLEDAPGRIVNRLGWVDDDAERAADTFDRTLDFGTRWKWTLVKDWRFSHFLNYSDRETKPKSEAKNERTFTTVAENESRSDAWTFGYNYQWMQEIKEYNPLSQIHSPLVAYRFNLYKTIPDEASLRGTYKEIDEQIGDLLSRSVEARPRLELHFPISAPALLETPDWDWWILDGRKLRLDQTIDINPTLSLNYSWQEDTDKSKGGSIIKKNSLSITTEASLIYDFTKNFKGTLGTKLIGFIDFRSPYENYYAAEGSISVSIVF